MHLAMLLEMAGEAMGDRIAIGPSSGGTTFAELAQRSRRVGAHLASRDGERLALVDLNSEAVPLGLFGAAMAGRAFVPINYRLADDQLRAVVRRAAPATLVAGPGVAERLGPIPGIELMTRKELLDVAADPRMPEVDGWDGDPEAIAVLLFTSGTTGEPKAAVLRHRNLASYVISTVELGSAGEDQATIVSVPPYHVAGIAAAISAAYAGRRAVLLEAFDPAAWVTLARHEAVTHAMVVPTMLQRILDVLEAEGSGPGPGSGGAGGSSGDGSGSGLPALRNLAYGGGPMPPAVVERALRLLPHVDFVNAYGLTETSSTIAILGPDDHRAALDSPDPAVRDRLGSVGRPLPSVEVTIRDADGGVLSPGQQGEIWVRGDQVSGEYLGAASLDAEGWFATRDCGHLDDDGYLYVHGRLDDVIVRGGENISPGEIEAVLLEHPAVADAAVVGIPDTEWGERVVAAVVCRPDTRATEAELQEHVRHALRSTRTPEHIQFRDQLPFNDTGKLLRRVLRTELTQAFG